MENDKKNKKHSSPKMNELSISGTQLLPALDGLEVNVNLPTHYVNIANIMASSDGMMLINFFTRIPGHNIETCRISLPHQTAKKMVDIICQQLDYRPDLSTTSVTAKKSGKK